MIDIKRFVDDKLKVKSWPAKHDVKVEVLRHVAAKFEPGRFYTEKEVNRIIDEWHTFNDYFLIRRELINNWFLSRTKSGSRYWKEETEENRTAAELISKNYDIGNVESVLHLADGSDSYYILSDRGEFVLKYVKESHADVIGNDVCPAKDGKPILKIQDKAYCLQKYI